MRHALVFIVAAIGILVANPASSYGQGETNPMGSPYNRLVNNHKQSLDAGWVPPTKFPKEFSRLDLTKETSREKSLRRAYNGATDRRREKAPNPYQGLVPKTSIKTASQVASEEVGQVDYTPELIKEAGDADKNYLIMLSSDNCLWCKRMYPTIKKLREEGYIVYYFNVSLEKFKDYGALYNAAGLPTFIVYEGGKEVQRKLGKTDIEWFHKHLKTRKAQDEADKPDQPDNPYIF